MSKFARLVWAHGARLQAWPESEREWARKMLDVSPEARRLAAEAAQVDGWLDSFAVPPVRAEVEARILASAATVPTACTEPGKAGTAEGVPILSGLLHKLPAGLFDQPLWRPALRPVYATIGAALFGLLLGWGGVFSQSAQAGEEEEILAMAFVGSELENYDLGEMP